MDNTLISFETVILANEKGFNEYTSRMESLYVILEDLWEQDHHNGNDFLMYAKDEIISSTEAPEHPGIKVKWIGRRPTQSILQKWLRDKHDIDLYVQGRKIMRYKYILEWYDEQRRSHTVSGNIYDTWEETLEEGLKEGLTLIK